MNSEVQPSPPILKGPFAACYPHVGVVSESRTCACDLDAVELERVDTRLEVAIVDVMIGLEASREGLSPLGVHREAISITDMIRELKL